MLSKQEKEDLEFAKKMIIKGIDGVIDFFEKNNISNLKEDNCVGCNCNPMYPDSEEKPEPCISPNCVYRK